MTQKFKFFRGFIGTINTMDGETYATASFYDPRTLTDEERLTQINRRIRIDEQFRNQGIITQEQYNLNRDMFAEHERERRQRIDNDNQIRLFQATTTVTVNPTLWTKIKIFGTRVKLVLIETWKLEPIGVVVMTLLVSVLTFIGVMKLFGA
jgi:hypothetical protein